MNSRIIAVTGGIGAGKSVVCGILKVMGYEVYDCDSRARAIMEGNPDIALQISREVCHSAVTPDGFIDRRILSKTVFSDLELLEKLNSIVHSYVRNDIREWSYGKSVCFVETAILYQSGLDRMVSRVWNVTAPEAVRVSRVMLRSCLTEHEVRQRIAAQDSFKPQNIHRHVCRIINDGIKPLLPQIEALINQ